MSESIVDVRKAAFVAAYGVAFLAFEDAIKAAVLTLQEAAPDIQVLAGRHIVNTTMGQVVMEFGSPALLGEPQ